MDNLEKFIRENRDHLDRHEPDQNIWSKIEIPSPGRRYSLNGIIARAAVVAILVASSFILYSITTSGNRSDQNKRQISVAKLPNDFIETEIYYYTRINNLLAEAKPLLLSNPGIENSYMPEISTLDSLCIEIRRDLKDNISNQEVIEALVMNYRIKVDILEEMLIILRQEELEIKDNPDHHEL